MNDASLRIGFAATIIATLLVLGFLVGRDTSCGAGAPFRSFEARGA